MPHLRDFRSRVGVERFDMDDTSANILRKRGLLTDGEASAMYDSMSLPLGLPKYAENPDVQDLQSNLDRLFAVVMEPK